MRVAWLGIALLLAGCGPKGEQSIDVVLKGDLQAGTLTLNCRASSSGTCHALVQTGDKVDRIDAPVGSTAAATGLDDRSRYCIGAEAQGDGCTLKPVVDGEQIIRRHKNAG